MRRFAPIAIPPATIAALITLATAAARPRRTARATGLRRPAWVFDRADRLADSEARR